MLNLKNVVHKFLVVLLLVSTSLQAKESFKILWVLDNSDSMADRRDLMIEGFEQFSEILLTNGENSYEMFFTTTDYLGNQGALVKTENGSSSVKSNGPIPFIDFTALVSRIADSPTSFWEQGLEASKVATQTISESLVSARDHLVVIYVSDEDDYSCKEDCVGVEPENNPNWKRYSLMRYVRYFNELKNRKRIKLSMFPVVGTVDGSCQVPSYGLHYMRLKEVISFDKGVTQSVCRQEFLESYLNIAHTLAGKATEDKPPTWIQNPIHMDVVVDQQPRILSLREFIVSDSRVEFSHQGGADFAEVNPSGIVFFSPSKEDIGNHRLIVRATNPSGLHADVEVTIAVTGQGGKPVALEEPIALEPAYEDTPFSKNLATSFLDPDGDELSFRLIAGPSWLSLTVDGMLQGIPTEFDVGFYRAIVEVTDGMNRITAFLHGEVRAVPEPES